MHAIRIGVAPIAAVRTVEDIEKRAFVLPSTAVGHLSCLVFFNPQTRKLESVYRCSIKTEPQVSGYF